MKRIVIPGIFAASFIGAYLLQTQAILDSAAMETGIIICKSVTIASIVTLCCFFILICLFGEGDTKKTGGDEHAR